MRVDQLGPNNQKQEFIVEVLKGEFYYGSYSHNEASGWWFNYSNRAENKGHTGMFAVVSASTYVTPPTRVQGDINQTNDLAAQNGCFVCVAADYERVKLSALLDRQGLKTKETQLGFLQKTENVVDGAKFIAAMKFYGITTSLEEAEVISDFDSWSAKAISECGSTETHDGALGYTGHVIRMRLTHQGIVLWDPQGSIGPFDLPPAAKQQCGAYWFH
jgi:hypothetical protein